MPATILRIICHWFLAARRGFMWSQIPVTDPEHVRVICDNSGIVWRICFQCQSLFFLPCIPGGLSSIVWRRCSAHRSQIHDCLRPSWGSAPCGRLFLVSCLRYLRSKVQPPNVHSASHTLQSVALNANAMYFGLATVASKKVKTKFGIVWFLDSECSQIEYYLNTQTQMIERLNE